MPEPQTFFIGPQQGHCSSVSSSILGDWWSRPWLGLKGTLSPPMKREISPPILVGWPTNRKKLTAWCFIFDLHSPTMTALSQAKRACASAFLAAILWTLLVLSKYLWLGELLWWMYTWVESNGAWKTVYVANLTKRGAIYRLLKATAESHAWESALFLQFRVGCLRSGRGILRIRSEGWGEGRRDAFRMAGTLLPHFYRTQGHENKKLWRKIQIQSMLKSPSLW